MEGNHLQQKRDRVSIFDASTGVVKEVEKINKSDEEWKSWLIPQQYLITRKKGTERAFSGKYYTLKEEGIYRCVCCGTDLFSSDTKFESGSGWPSFWAPVSEKNVSTNIDYD